MKRRRYRRSSASECHGWNANIVDHIVSGNVALLINTPLGKKSQYDDYAMRRAAITYGVPYLTTMSATSAAVDALIALKARVREVRSIQERIESLMAAAN